MPDFLVAVAVAALRVAVVDFLAAVAVVELRVAEIDCPVAETDFPVAVAELCVAVAELCVVSKPFAYFIIYSLCVVCIIYIYT